LKEAKTGDINKAKTGNKKNENTKEPMLNAITAKRYEAL
jgi:hypothetical protein